MPPEILNRISEKLKGRRMSDEHYRELSDLMKALWDEPAMRATWTNSRAGRVLSDETKKKIGDANRGRVFSDDHKNKLSVARRKRKTKPETRRKRSRTSTGKINIKQYLLIDPDGNEHTTPRGLTDFCRGLTASLMSKVINGQRPHHKGWTGKRLDNPE